MEENKPVPDDTIIRWEFTVDFDMLHILRDIRAKLDDKIRNAVNDSESKNRFIGASIRIGETIKYLEEKIHGNRG